MNGFAVSGDEFSSSYNTIDDGESGYFHLRRLYVRHVQSFGKTEFGYIPTFKGRVSSTGLSKDGWIAGIRQVVQSDAGEFEVVLGEMTNTEKRDPIRSVKNLDYIELEFSSAISNQFSYEASLERMLGDNFFRGEVRYHHSDDTVFALEAIDRLSEHQGKVILSVETITSLFGEPIELFGYYSYVGTGFGQRAELTEDFLSTGHGLALELEGAFPGNQFFDWFAKFEGYEGSTRFQLGIKGKLTLRGN